MVQWIISNKEWIFSGLGIAIISAFFAILKTKTPKGGEGNLNVSGNKNVIGDGNIVQITNFTEEKQQSNIKIVDISLNEDKEFIEIVVEPSMFPLPITVSIIIVVVLQNRR